MKNAIDRTSKENYITSIAALNIPSQDGTGDWHFSACFIQHEDIKPSQHIAGIDTISTYNQLGDYGIYDCFDILKKYGASPLPEKTNIYAANHYRAVTDMVYHLVQNEQDILKTVILDEWFPEPSEKETVYQLLEKMRPELTAEKWERIKAWKKLTRKTSYI
jgi:hypothetical protein